ncbi:hypothetical protein CALCODRAFT_518941 [Calocera cornea HHB12733]|uniref:Uncharacterized protein n=1 Tax=Calocera cornea HHB12733 TaxID=1353952 RepID=A0A165EMU3_9BASI|nr:hypothetical protein CALCODRAFT_518941 [Calocera cornea HHB12733]
MSEYNYVNIPAGVAPRVYGMAAGWNTVLVVAIQNFGNVTMTGSGDLWLKDPSGRQVHQFPRTSQNTVATVSMYVGGKAHYMVQLQNLGNSIKLGEPGGVEKVVISW